MLELGKIGDKSKINWLCNICAPDFLLALPKDYWSTIGVKVVFAIFFTQPTPTFFCNHLLLCAFGQYYKEIIFLKVFKYFSSNEGQQKLQASPNWKYEKLFYSCNKDNYEIKISRQN